MIVLLAGILGGVFDPGGDTKAAVCACACDRVFTLSVPPLLAPASVSGWSPILAAGPSTQMQIALDQHDSERLHAKKLRNQIADAQSAQECEAG